MKTELLSIDGKKVKEIELPSIFSVKIRDDIIRKVFEAEKTMQPYAPYYMAGRQHSASGRIRHIRHKWRTAYGKGISRIPRKTMWRRGTQFYWIGAEISGTRGGRRAHPPKILSQLNAKKINKKEFEMAFKSAIATTADNNLVKSRYARLEEIKVQKLPIVVESKLIELKTQELFEAINKILGGLNIIAKKEKSVRSGKGKLRNRRYKTTAGVLLVTGNDESIKTKAVDSKRVDELEIKDFYPMGRLTIYTEKAIKDLEAMK
ncbi:MAG: 50S ribosomal protein L4 [Candidatus Pacearchaeota archaeon]|jgi:large subunit ribosomal protein L4e